MADAEAAGDAAASSQPADEPANKPVVEPAVAPVGAAPAEEGEGASQSVRFATATYDYDGQADDELSFKDGDRIEVLREIDEQWLEGCVQALDYIRTRCGTS